jgi:inosine-uridine nucleoside N-ribohydrolase
LKNVVALFHVLEKEQKWRQAQGLNTGFEALSNSKPLVAVGASHPLEEEILMADFFHGADGLGGVHDSHPHLSPDDAWKSIFSAPPEGATHLQKPEDLQTPSDYFIASSAPAHQEILRLLRENDPDTITIVAIGPLTNLALAASEDTETFLRVKEVVVMGGAINIQGNITPVAEFNTYADAIATARVLALTSPMPSSTMPPHPPTPVADLPPYPPNLSRQLKLTLFPLDITELHLLTQSAFEAKVHPLREKGSPLAEWVSVFMGKTFDKIQTLTNGYADPGLSLHDPLTIWYCLTHAEPSWTLASAAPEDIRVETAGQWTRGMHVIDRRNRRRIGGKRQDSKSGINNPLEETYAPEDMQGDDGEGNLTADEQGWLTGWKGNRVRRMAGSPGEDKFAPFLLERIFC